MNREIREKLNAQEKKGNTPRKAVRIVEVSDKPLLSEELLEKDKRESDLVEINLRDQSAQVVETSKAPKLTHGILKEKGKPIKSVEFFFDGDEWTVYVRDGRPLSLDIAEDRIRADYKKRLEKISKEDTPETKAKRTLLIREMNTAISQLTIAKMITDPVFSYNSDGDGHPIEKQTRILWNALTEAYQVVNHPVEDSVFTVEVSRGVPGETAILLLQGFEAYPLGSLGKKTIDLSDTEIDQLEASNLAQKRVMVSSMLLKLNLSYNGHGRKNAYPVEEICGRFLETLHNAYKVSNIPAERLQALRRFPRVGNRDGNRTEAVP